MRRINKYKFKQWAKPKRLIYKGFGVSVWKWCGVLFPLFTVHLNKCFFGYDIFHNGSGFVFHFPPLLIVNICTSGKIAWTYKKGIFRVRVNNLELRW